MNDSLRIQPGTTSGAYPTNNDSAVDSAQKAARTAEVMEIVKRFGLEDNSALTNELLETPASRLNSLLLDSANNKLDGLQQATADIFTIMALIARMSQENRQTARESREAERQAQYAELQTAANEIRQAADMALAAGIVSGVMKMASGAVSIGGGIKGLKDLKGVSTATPDLPTTTDTPSVTPQTQTWKSATPSAWKSNSPSTTNTTPDTPTTTPTTKNPSTAAGGPSDATVEMVRLRGNMYQGASTIVASVGDLVAAGLNRMAEENRAEQKEAETDALKHETFAQNENDFMNSMDELIKDMRRMIQEISQLNNDTEKKIASV